MINFHSEPGVKIKDSLRFTDNDIGNALNLLRDIPSWEMYYPRIVFDSATKKSKPDVLSIGDSFNQSFWGFYPYFSALFGPNTRYWYYNKLIGWPDSLERKAISVESLDLKKEIDGGTSNLDTYFEYGQTAAAIGENKEAIKEEGLFSMKTPLPRDFFLREGLQWDKEVPCKRARSLQIPFQFHGAAFGRALLHCVVGHKITRCVQSCAFSL